jgi:hypothetical protein
VSGTVAEAVAEEVDVTVAATFCFLAASAVVRKPKSKRNPHTDLSPILTRQSHKRFILLRVAAVSYCIFFF